MSDTWTLELLVLGFGQWIVDIERVCRALLAVTMIAHQPREGEDDSEELGECPEEKDRHCEHSAHRTFRLAKSDQRPKQRDEGDSQR